MSIIYILIPIAVLLTCIGIYVFFWAVKTEQFEDLEKQGMSILFDDPKELKQQQSISLEVEVEVEKKNLNTNKASVREGMPIQATPEAKSKTNKPKTDKSNDH